MKFTVKITGSATLSVDSGPAFPITDQHGKTLNQDVGVAGNNAAFCFTNATSGGSVTPAWRYQPLGYPGGWIKRANDYWYNDATMASSHGVGLVAYESGQTYVAGGAGGDVAYENLYYAAMRDPRMGAAYRSYYYAMRATSPGLITVFADAVQFSQWGTWGVLENILDASSPRYDATANFTR